MNRQTFVLYNGFYEPIKNLSLEQKGMLLDAIFQYRINNVEVPQESPIFMPFMFFKNQFLVDDAKYDVIVNRNRINGLKGGRPAKKPRKPSGISGNPNNPEEPRGTQRNPNDNDNDNDNDKIKKERLKKEILPPSFDEFKAYCNVELKEYDIDIDNVFQGYAVNNWYDSQGTQIKNWKQKLRQVWCKKKKTDFTQSPADSKFAIGQKHFNEGEGVPTWKPM